MEPRISNCFSLIIQYCCHGLSEQRLASFLSCRHSYHSLIINSFRYWYKINISQKWTIIRSANHSLQNWSQRALLIDQSGQRYLKSTLFHLKIVCEFSDAWVLFDINAKSFSIQCYLILCMINIKMWLLLLCQ